MKMKKLILLSLTLLTAASPVLAGEPWGEALELAVGLLQSIDQEKPSEPVNNQEVANAHYDRKKLSPFDHLPDEILCEIFEYLLAEYFNLNINDPSVQKTAQEINNLRLTNKQFNRILNGEILLKRSLLETPLSENSQSRISLVSKGNTLKKLSLLSSKQIPPILTTQLKELYSSTSDRDRDYILNQFLRNPELYHRVKKQLLTYINDFANAHGLPQDWAAILDSKTLLELGLIKLCFKTLLIKPLFGHAEITPGMATLVITATTLRLATIYWQCRYWDQPLWIGLIFREPGIIASYLLRNQNIVKKLGALTQLRRIKQ